MLRWKIFSNMGIFGRAMTPNERDDYAYGFHTELETERLKPGLSEEVIRTISSRKKEPAWVLNLRCRAYQCWKKMQEPHWATFSYPPIDYQALSYFAAPVQKGPKSLEDIDPKILAMYEKLGVPLEEQKVLLGVEQPKVAVDAVLDSISITTTFRKELRKKGIVFCSMQEAIVDFPDLVQKYLTSVVPSGDNFYAALNTAVFSDGTFVYIPEGVRCPMELSTYFRINSERVGQFERTLIVADKNAYVSYLEGCTAPMFKTKQLHAAVVELVAMEGAEIKYSTVQNWYPGTAAGQGGVYNFVTKRGLCAGDDSKIFWTQVETGSALTWKYPGCVLKGKRSRGSFYSVTISKYHQAADTGTKMIHLGEGTTSTIISKGISREGGAQTYRGIVHVAPSAKGARNFTQCDSLLLSDGSVANTLPDIFCKVPDAKVEHEASTSKLDEDQLWYCMSRGVDETVATSLVVKGFCREVLQHLPMEFAVEAQKLIEINMEGSVG